MSEARNPCPAALDPEKAARLAMALLLYGKSPAKVAKACRMWLESAEALEAQALPRANVYPIRGQGEPHGYRPADRDALEAARFLKTFAAERLRLAAHA